MPLAGRRTGVPAGGAVGVLLIKTVTWSDRPAEPWEVPRTMSGLGSPARSATASTAPAAAGTATAWRGANVPSPLPRWTARLPWSPATTTSSAPSPSKSASLPSVVAEPIVFVVLGTAPGRIPLRPQTNTSRTPPWRWPTSRSRSPSPSTSPTSRKYALSALVVRIVEDHEVKLLTGSLPYTLTSRVLSGLTPTTSS